MNEPDRVEITAADFNWQAGWDGLPFRPLTEWVEMAVAEGALIPGTPNNTDYAEWRLRDEHRWFGPGAQVVRAPGGMIDIEARSDQGDGLDESGRGLGADFVAEVCDIVCPTGAVVGADEVKRLLALLESLRARLRGASTGERIEGQRYYKVTLGGEVAGKPYMADHGVTATSPAEAVAHACGMKLVAVVVEGFPTDGGEG